MTTGLASLSKARILVIEDEPDLRLLIETHLKRDGHETVAVGDGESAFMRVQDEVFDLIVVDWMLPGLSGLDLIRSFRIKPDLKGLPILMLTARNEAADVVLGLEAGADDFVAKPFDSPVFLARVRALLRRSQWLFLREDSAKGSERRGDGLQLPVSYAQAALSVVRLGQLELRPDSHEVFCHGEKVDLTPSEFRLLMALSDARGKVLTRDKLIEAVQGVGVVVVDRAVDTHVFGLRKKLGKCSSTIETVRGVGYRVRSD